MRKPPYVVVSACLVGHRTRYDGGHQTDLFITQFLGKFLKFLPICPEAEARLGVPRQPMRLVSRQGKTRLITRDTQEERTDQLLDFTRDCIADLQARSIGGFILKARSPSCGIGDARLYDRGGRPSGRTSGLFASAVQKAYPMAAVISDSALHVQQSRNDFLDRLFCCHRLMQLDQNLQSFDQLEEFYVRHETMLMAHSPRHTQELAQLLARGADQNLRGLLASCRTLLRAALDKPATVSSYVAVLRQTVARLKHIAKADSAELSEAVRGYRDGRVPLIVPVTLLRHHLRAGGDPNADRFFWTDGAELTLRYGG